MSFGLECDRLCDERWIPIRTNEKSGRRVEFGDATIFALSGFVVYQAKERSNHKIQRYTEYVSCNGRSILGAFEALPSNRNF